MNYNISKQLGKMSVEIGIQTDNGLGAKAVEAINKFKEQNINSQKRFRLNNREYINERNRIYYNKVQEENSVKLDRLNEIESLFKQLKIPLPPVERYKYVKVGNKIEAVEIDEEVDKKLSYRQRQRREIKNKLIRLEMLEEKLKELGIED